ncbi:MAG: hypothetical protein GX294_02475 [Candidatus Cloacimonetes bacterium]|nr:hypothetical protein [Candidatus Cloacimonadota bacterium]
MYFSKFKPGMARSISHPHSPDFWEQCFSDYQDLIQSSPLLRLKRALIPLRGLLGAQALQLLIHHADTPLSAQDILQTLAGTHQISHHAPPPQLAGTSPHTPPLLCETAIPVSDARCLNQVRQRLKILQDKKDNTPRGRISTAEQKELDALQKYLSDSLLPDGRVRSFTDNTHRARVALNAALRRVRRRLAQVDPALDGYLEEHLLMAPHFQWRSQGSGDRDQGALTPNT